MSRGIALPRELRSPPLPRISLPTFCSIEFWRTIMSYTVLQDSQSKILETKFHGTITLNEMKEAFSEVLRIAQESGNTLFLNNFSNATVDLSTMDIFHFPLTLTTEATPFGFNARKLKRVIVVPSKHLRDARFAEDVSVNSGHTVGAFEDPDEARAWLLRD
jgi:hypothetical protein